MESLRSYPVLDVLTRSGAARDAFIADLGATVDTDTALVSDVLRVTGRVGAALATRHTLVELCAVVRALDAWQTGHIDLPELATGFAAHTNRTDHFERFGAARVDLRTLDELFSRARAADFVDEAPLRAQVMLLHAELRAWLLRELTGTVDGGFPQVTEREAEPLPPPATRIERPELLRLYNALADELLAGAAWFDFRGLVAAAWRRGWAAVPRAGERLGDDRDELMRMSFALAAAGIDELLEIDLAPRARWHLRRDRIDLADGLRRVVSIPADAAGIELVASDRRAHALFTTAAGACAVLEGDDHHVVAGPRSFVEAVCGCSTADGLAAFRDYADARSGEDDTPGDLAGVADRYGRLRRRGRAGGS